MGSEGNMPRKIFEAPFLEDPRPDIYKQLTQKNAEYPVTDMDNAVSYLPDFTRAVELGDFIYRVNVPGYFYKCPAAGGTMSTAQPSGIVIDGYNYVMDTLSHHDHRISKINNNKTGIAGWHGNIRGRERHDTYVTGNFKLYIDAVDKSPGSGAITCTINWQSGDTVKTKDVYSKDTDLENGTVNINGVMAKVAVLSNQRRCPSMDFSNTSEPFTRDLACNYVVHAGKNNCGGIMNSLAAIIPGVATTNKPVGGVLSETTEANITRIAKYNNLFYCTYAIPTDGLVEAIGTYVFANKSADRIFFVPAKAAPTTVKPVTKIRATTAASCNYHIPANKKSHDLPIGPTTSCSMHYSANKAACSWAKEEAKTYSGTLGTTDCSGTITGCYIVMEPHTEAFDDIFRIIFSNPSLTGHTEPFIAQQLSLEPWPGTYRGSVDDIIGHAKNAHHVFDPKTDGA